jgi:hypothetical protein
MLSFFARVVGQTKAEHMVVSEIILGRGVSLDRFYRKTWCKYYVANKWSISPFVYLSVLDRWDIKHHHAFLS